MSVEKRPIYVGDVVRIMDEWAPAWTAESWDRVGLLVGDPKAPAARIMVALELDEDLLDKALNSRTQMLLLHHPPLFKPLSDLRTDKPQIARILKAAGGGLALFAAHTNLDAAPGGVNDALAAKLGLENTRPLEPVHAGMAKLVTFVPSDHLEKVRQALFAAGAGIINQYKECSFTSPGQGGFLAPPDGKPFLGSAGERQVAEEIRLEVVIPAKRAASIITSLSSAHPYEEPAVDIYPLNQGPAGFGLGRVGYLPRSMEGDDFLTWAARELGSVSPVVAGFVPEKVNKVAVLGGSGGDFLDAAASAGADVLVTGEAGYHMADRAADLGVCLLVLGHFETEQVIVGPWARRLSAEFDARGYQAEVRPWTSGRSPWRPVSVG